MRKIITLVVFIIFMMILIAVLSDSLRRDPKIECLVDTDCNDFKQYCDTEKSINECLQFDCGSYMFGLGDYWTCGEYNVCVLMCKYNVTDGECHYQKQFIDKLIAKGCIWHRVYIQEPEGGFKENSILTAKGWVCS